MPRSIATVISAGKATLYECDTIYGVEDIYGLLEIILVDAHNKYVYEKWAQRRL
jgi:hypothetical protein